MSDPAGMKPRLLLVEDDPVSSHFMVAALEALPAEVVAATSCAEAQALPSCFDLWLLDAHLPDGDGVALLARLRAGSPRTPALAHTADPSPELRAHLLHAGFAEVLVKPLGVAQLQRSARETLAPPARNAHPAPDHALPGTPAAAMDWDDGIALKALGGRREHVAQLRQLFLAELPAARAACLAAFDRWDDSALRASLHKLRASCGFVGAAALEQAVAAWHAAPASPALRDAFDAAAQRLSV